MARKSKIPFRIPKAETEIISLRVMLLRAEAGYTRKGAEKVEEEIEIELDDLDQGAELMEMIAEAMKAEGIELEDD